MPPVSVRVLNPLANDDTVKVVVYHATTNDRAALTATGAFTPVACEGLCGNYRSVAHANISTDLANITTKALANRRRPPTQFVSATGPVMVDPPIVMGVLNVTPDSFFDGGVAYKAGDATVAIDAGLRLAAAGAAIVDVGGESTRPGAAVVGVAEELERVVPVVAGLVEHGVRASIDTRKAAVATACLHAGATIVNDVSGGLYDPQMFDTVISYNAGYVLMHMQGTPETMQQNPTYTDVVADVFTFLADRVASFVAAGGRIDQVVVDPGIGFGKRVNDNVALLTALDELHALGTPVLVGVSHKSVLGAFTGHADPAQRHAASIAAHALAVHAGAQIVRAHDVAASVDALAVAHALRR